MDYFQGVVTDYLRAKRSQFVNTEYMINLDQDGTYLKGRHWYCDAVAIDFSESTVHLCEITYSKTLHAVGVRLQAWANNWPGVVAAIRRDSSLDEKWLVTPRVFLPQSLGAIMDQKLKGLKHPQGVTLPMPQPIVTALEDVVPWKYRSWNGKAFTSNSDPSPPTLCAINGPSPEVAGLDLMQR